METCYNLIQNNNIDRNSSVACVIRHAYTSCVRVTLHAHTSCLIVTREAVMRMRN